MTKKDAYNRIINDHVFEFNGKKIYQGALITFDHGYPNKTNKYVLHKGDGKYLYCYRKLSDYHDRKMKNIVKNNFLVAICFNMQTNKITSECYISNLKYIEYSLSGNTYYKEVRHIKNLNIYVLLSDLHFNGLKVYAKNKSEAIEIFQTLLKKKYQHYKNYKINEKTVLRCI